MAVQVRAEVCDPNQLVDAGNAARTGLLCKYMSKAAAMEMPISPPAASPRASAMKMLCTDQQAQRTPNYRSEPENKNACSEHHPKCEPGDGVMLNKDFA